MSKISAFVGHSFDESDSQLIRSFTDFLETLKKSELISSWDHAEEAQALEIADKVKDKFLGKTLFIGICTKKEKVVKASYFKKLICFNWFFANGANVEWKTSDWVLQELGYSQGLGLKTILLIEDGVREIKGLHGNHEFIKFDRENPSLAFQKIIQQIASIETNRSTVEQSEESAKATDTEKTETTKASSDEFDYKNPTLDWKYGDFLWAMHLAIWGKKVEEEDRVNDFYKKLHADDKPQLLKWEGEYLYQKQMWKNESALGALTELIKDNPGNVDLHFNLGKSLERYKDYKAAYDAYSKALTSGLTWNNRFLSRTISCLAQFKGKDEAKIFVEKISTTSSKLKQIDFHTLLFTQSFSKLIPRMSIAHLLKQHYI